MAKDKRTNASSLDEGDVLAGGRLPAGTLDLGEGHVAALMDQSGTATGSSSCLDPIASVTKAFLKRRLFGEGPQAKVSDSAGSLLHTSDALQRGKTTFHGLNLLLRLSE